MTFLTYFLKFIFGWQAAMTLNIYVKQTFHGTVTNLKIIFAKNLYLRKKSALYQSETDSALDLSSVFHGGELDSVE